MSGHFLKYHYKAVLMFIFLSCLIYFRGESADVTLDLHYQAGGAAGGSIWIEANRLTSTGELRLKKYQLE